MQESIHNLVHAQEYATEAKNYHEVVRYSREFAARLADNNACLADNNELLAQIKAEIGKCNGKLDQLLKPREPQNKSRFLWRDPAPAGQ